MLAQARRAVVRPARRASVRSRPPAKRDVRSHDGERAVSASRGGGGGSEQPAARPQLGRALARRAHRRGGAAAAPRGARRRTRDGCRATAFVITTAARATLRRRRHLIRRAADAGFAPAPDGPPPTRRAAASRDDATADDYRRAAETGNLRPAVGRPCARRPRGRRCVQPAEPSARRAPAARWRDLATSSRSSFTRATATGEANASRAGGGLGLSPRSRHRPTRCPARRHPAEALHSSRVAASRGR